MIAENGKPANTQVGASNQGNPSPESGDGFAAESNRDRVRRLLITPLQTSGMRFARGTKDERAKLDQITDDLAYMADAALIDLRLTLRTKGEGAQRCFWPSRISILALAELRQKRPLVEMPSLLRWFASDAGRRAQDGGRLVAEYWFWTRHKRPPMNPHEHRLIADRASEQTARVERLAEREARGALGNPDDQQWLDGYRERMEYVAGLVSDQKGGRT